MGVKLKIKKRLAKYWLIRLTKSEAKDLKLEFYTNVHGDMINRHNCRSFWLDKEGNDYKVIELGE